ncbi:MAG: hypothetical protein RR595_12140, partial [Lysinibacillus sp.]
MASKREVKPFVDARTKSAIEKLSYITGESVNKIGESLCTNATSNMDIIEEISQYFKRDLRIHDKTYVGNKSAKVISHRQPDKERISVLLNQQLHEFVYTLSYAIGCSVGKAAALCVEKSIADTHYLNHFIQNYIEKILNDKDQIKLRL